MLCGTFLVSFYYSLKEGGNVVMNEEIKEKITKMQSDFLGIYNYKNGDDVDGNNKNMGN